MESKSIYSEINNKTIKNIIKLYLSNNEKLYNILLKLNSVIKKMIIFLI
jgi:hypothetical protein